MMVTICPIRSVDFKVMLCGSKYISELWVKCSRRVGSLTAQVHCSWLILSKAIVDVGV